MKLTLPCDHCGQHFQPSKSQLEFLRESKAKGMDFIMLTCDSCGEDTVINPQTNKCATDEAETVAYRCPVSHCAGYVSLVDDEPFWGCGECGSLWYEKTNLLEEIDAMVAKFPYRRKCYRKRSGQWQPAAADKEPDDYEEQVEREPHDRSGDFVRG